MEVLIRDSRRFSSHTFASMKIRNSQWLDGLVYDIDSYLTQRCGTHSVDIPSCITIALARRSISPFPIRMILPLPRSCINTNTKTCILNNDCFEYRICILNHRLYINGGIHLADDLITSPGFVFPPLRRTRTPNRQVQVLFQFCHKNCLLLKKRTPDN